MRALLPLFNQPFPHTVFTAEFAAAWTYYGIFNFAETNETFEQFFNVLVCTLFLFFSIMSTVS